MMCNRMFSRVRVMNRGAFDQISLPSSAKWNGPAVLMPHRRVMQPWRAIPSDGSLSLDSCRAGGCC
jgi:hypothetical protein